MATTIVMKFVRKVGTVNVHTCGDLFHVELKRVLIYMAAKAMWGSEKVNYFKNLF